MDRPRLIRVMLVGDDRLLAARLERAPREPDAFELVDEAGSDEQACARAAELRPDVILIDIEARGLEAVARLAAHGAAPVLALAPAGDAAMRMRAMRAGARGVVHKDDTPATLRNHFSAIYRKLGIPNRVGLVAYAARQRIDDAG